VRASRAIIVFVGFCFFWTRSSRGQVSHLRNTHPPRYRLDRMETRSKTTSSPPREVTEGDTGPVSDHFVGQPSSATGLPRDGKVPSRSTSVEAGPRSACRPSTISERGSGTLGPAQGAENDENRGCVGTTCSDVTRIPSTDDQLDSTNVCCQR